MSAHSLLALAAFLRARHRLRRLDTRERLEAFQSACLRRFLARDVPAVAAYRGQRYARLSDAPVSDKAALMARFEDFNRLRLDAATGWDMFEGRLAPPRGYAVGASTGTSGNRGLYVVSDRERYLWLGVMLARALPDFLTRPERVAVLLPQASRLYDAANESGRLKLSFFSLDAGIEATLSRLETDRPTTLVAPPRVLTALALSDRNLAPRQVFSGAEVLDPADRAIIEARFGVRVREIYMATEGLFAIACPFGTLHLVEDHVAFEWLPVAGSAALVSPLVTDFTRRTQIMLRYRMNDLVELAAAPCPCGSPHRALAAVHGRQDDAFTLSSRAGMPVTLTPDVIRNAVLDAHRGISDYRVIQTGAQTIRLELPASQAAFLPCARESLQALLDKAGVHAQIEAISRDFGDEGPRKRRRVRVEDGQARQ